MKFKREFGLGDIWSGLGLCLLFYATLERAGKLPLRWAMPKPLFFEIIAALIFLAILAGSVRLRRLERRWETLNREQDDIFLRWRGDQEEAIREKCRAACDAIEETLV